MNILVCPVCKGKLELHIEKETEQEVIAGWLYCARGDVKYPVADAIPNLMPPEYHR